MPKDPDEDRIRQKAHQLWEAEGHPHGRDRDHWAQAREIIAVQDSQADTLLPRDAGAEEPIEDADEALRNVGEFPGLTDQGENLLTSTDREPALTAANPATVGEIPSPEISTSGQPGVSSVKRAVSKPEADMKASTKKDAVPSGKSTAASGKTSSASGAPKSAALKAGSGTKPLPSKTT